MDLLIQLNKNSQLPVYKQVVNQVVQLVRDGKVLAGDKLPSSRSLAENLGVSRNTIIKAYEELEILGYVKNHPSKGSFISESSDVTLEDWHDETDSYPIDQSILSEYGNRILYRDDIEYGSVELIDELNQSAPVKELLPVNQWHKCIQNSIRQKSYLNLNNKDIFGNRELRLQLSKYLARSRGLSCRPEQICLFNSTQSGLDILARTVIDEDDTVLVEEPGFPGARRTFACYGANVETLTVDKNGANTEKLSDLSNSPPKLIYLTPNHHDPLGVVLSEERRKALLNWMKNQSCYVVEDDFDSDYRYSEMPPAPLKSIDTDDKVIYLSSFWKVLFPVTCLGFMVLPKTLIPMIHRAKELCERDLDRIEHYALASFIENGSLEKHIKRTRKIYATRRKHLVQYLNKFLRGLVSIHPVAAGTHLILTFEDEFSTTEILDSAKQADLPLAHSDPFYKNSKKREDSFLLSFAYKDENYMLDAIENFSVRLKNSRQ